MACRLGIILRLAAHFEAYTLGHVDLVVGNVLQTGVESLGQIGALEVAGNGEAALAATMNNAGGYPAWHHGAHLAQWHASGAARSDIDIADIFAVEVAALDIFEDEGHLVVAFPDLPYLGFAGGHGKLQLGKRTVDPQLRGADGVELYLYDGARLIPVGMYVHQFRHLHHTGHHAFACQAQ